MGIMYQGPLPDPQRLPIKIKDGLKDVLLLLRLYYVSMCMGYESAKINLRYYSPTVGYKQLCSLHNL